MTEMMRYFVVFAPIGLLAAVALLLMGQVYRMVQLSESFAWLETEGHRRGGSYDFAGGHLARAGLCRSAFRSLCVSAMMMAFAVISAAIVMRNPTLWHTPTFILVVIGLVSLCHAMVTMVLDARVELEMFRARYQYLTAGRTPPGEPRAA